MILLTRPDDNRIRTTSTSSLDDTSSGNADLKNQTKSNATPTSNPSEPSLQSFTESLTSPALASTSAYAPALPPNSYVNEDLYDENEMSERERSMLDYHPSLLRPFMGLRGIGHLNDPWRLRPFNLYNPIFGGGGTFESLLNRFKRNVSANPTYYASPTLPTPPAVPNKNVLTPAMLERLLRIKMNFEKNYPFLYKTMMGHLTGDKHTSLSITPPEIPEHVSYPNLELAAAEINQLETFLEKMKTEEVEQPQLGKPYEDSFKFLNEKDLHYQSERALTLDNERRYRQSEQEGKVNVYLQPNQRHEEQYPLQSKSNEEQYHQRNHEDNKDRYHPLYQPDREHQKEVNEDRYHQQSKGNGERYQQHYQEDNKYNEDDYHKPSIGNEEHNHQRYQEGNKQRHHPLYQADKEDFYPQYQQETNEDRYDEQSYPENSYGKDSYHQLHQTDAAAPYQTYRESNEDRSEYKHPQSQEKDQENDTPNEEYQPSLKSPPASEELYQSLVNPLNNEQSFWDAFQQEEQPEKYQPVTDAPQHEEVSFWQQFQDSLEEVDSPVRKRESFWSALEAAEERQSKERDRHITDDLDHIFNSDEDQD